MSIPVAPLVGTNPIGLAVLGIGGFFVYKAGKKAGLKGDTVIEKPGIGDRAVKGAMKGLYKVKKSTGEALSKTGAKYSSMWNEARNEMQAAE